MKTEKDSLFLKYLKISSEGLIFGIFLGIILILYPIQGKYFLELGVAAALVTFLIYHVAIAYDFSLLFGSAISIGMGLMAGMYFLKFSSLKVASGACAMVGMAFFINYAFLKLLRHTVRAIIAKNKEKNKNKK